MQKKLYKLLEFNKQFVQDEQYEPMITDGHPNEGLLILSCMDARLVELAHRSLGLKNGDVKFLKNAGAQIQSDDDSIMGSILVGTYALGCEEVVIMGHTDCGFGKLKPEVMFDAMKEKGITDELIQSLDYDFDNMFTGFSVTEDNVRKNVEKVRNHPLFNKEIPVHGVIIDSKTGEVTLIDDGYKQ
ncbi:beta-class carbonic anhydrase [Abyssicoccus albus]|uniref:carbonic anhydrase n=1 Tax=Abyssicoccus albus TaxID=1817405 RepID=A0A3N5BDZ9_9BACL|nr:carbonic anhydrase [Abyssicoccus albus]RPF55149.1 carbonic anhydrase [Abyssicoccus albus]